MQGRDVHLNLVFACLPVDPIACEPLCHHFLPLEEYKFIAVHNRRARNKKGEENDHCASVVLSLCQI